MASPFRSQATLPGVALVDPQPSDADHVRDSIAMRAQRMDARFPRALDLEASVLVALAGELRGVASALSGIHAPEHMREMLRGERSMPLGDLCRLATDPSREARAAASAAVSVLATCVEARPVTGTLAQRVAEMSIAATALLADLARAQEDGRGRP